MKILLVGSSGFISSALRSYLVSKGDQVICLTWLPDQKGGFSFFKGSHAEKALPEELEGFDAWVHLPGESLANQRWDVKKKERILKSRLFPTRLLAETVEGLNQPPHVWINASSIHYYGNRGDDVLTEESPVGQGFLARVCSEWETAVAPASEKGVRVVLSRFGDVLSPKGGILKRLLFPFKWGFGGMVGDGGQYMSWIAIDDLVNSVKHILQHKTVQGPVNVVTPYPVSNYDFTKALGTVLKRPTVVPLAALVAKMVFGKEMATELLLCSIRAHPKKLIDSGYVFHYPKLQRALAYLLQDA